MSTRNDKSENFQTQCFWVLSLCLSSFAWSVTNDSNENLFLSSPLQFALSPNEDEKLPSSFVSLFHWKQKKRAGRKVYLEYKNRFLGSQPGVCVLLPMSVCVLLFSAHVEQLSQFRASYTLAGQNIISCSVARKRNCTLIK